MQRRSTQLNQSKITSGRQTLSGKPNKATDNRPLRDQAYIQQCAERLHSFLQDWNFECPSEKQFQQGIQLKQIINITNFLIEKLGVQLPEISTDLKNPQTVFNGFSNIMSVLGYPDTNAFKQNELNSCSQPQTWRKFLLFLTWLVELTDYSLSVNLTGEGEFASEKIDVSVFIKELCQSEEPTLLLQGPRYFDFFSQLYSGFLSNPDEEILKSSLETNFNLWVENATDSEQKIQAQITKIDTDIKRLKTSLDTEIKTAKDELLDLQGICVENQLDFTNEIDFQQLNSFDCLMDIKRTNLQKIDEVQVDINAMIQNKERVEIPQLMEQIEQIETQITSFTNKNVSLQNELQSLQETVSKQNISIPDYQKLEFEHSTLKEQINEVQREVHELSSQLQEKQQKSAKISKSIQQNCANMGLNPQVLTIQLLKQTLDDARKEYRGSEQKIFDLNSQLQSQELEKENLERELGLLQKKGDDSRRQLLVIKQEFDTKQVQQQVTNQKQDERQRNIKNEINSLLEKKRALQYELSEIEGQKQQLTGQLQRESSKAEQDLQNISQIIGQLTLQVVESRNHARKSLELVRDKIGDALLHFK
ncbi:HEC/Ndc80p domain-containing protein [Spironucleus salmonicida]|uniref:Kinetochore protein NDC80 n=1 Tax=Spironucleus salmonicida TaxID=348837 RepID=V6LHE3_9EUKA|nr:HEC/Ndc80p domain-containing protein [Spironucleus salmonicida]|eukprot:EST43985.1 HEC/Ndc80p domain-containing protein [Spironucleus salmonicida]